MKMPSRKFTAAFRKSGTLYSAWIEEIPGVNTQGRTLGEARTNLQEALVLILETNKMLASQDSGKGKIFRESLVLV